MRVTAGTLRGRLLITARGRQTRPTSSKVREAIFNIVGSAVEGARVLDLFAGSGALGIEALSRGAASAVFVDSSRASAGVISQNVKKLGLGDRASVLCTGVLPALRKLSLAGDKFELVLADPPYSLNVAQATVSQTADCDLVTPGGLVVLEHGRNQEMAGRYGSLVLTAHRRYGDTHVSVFVHRFAGKAPRGAKSEEGGT